MIDITCEKLIPLAKVTTLPWMPSGVHKLRPYQWAKGGVRSIKLETLPVGGKLCTSEAALLRFFERLAGPKIDGVAKATPSERRKAIERAEAVLAADGI